MDKLAQTLGDLIPDFAKRTLSIDLRTGYRRGVPETPMDALCRHRERRARLVRIVTNCDDAVECLATELVDRFGAMARDVDAELTHHANRFRTDRGRMRSGAENLEVVASKLPQKALRHLAARGIGRA